MSRDWKGSESRLQPVKAVTIHGAWVEPNAAHQAKLEFVPNDSFPTLSSIFVETLCRSPVENGLFRQSFPTKDSDKDSATRPLGQTRPTPGRLKAELRTHEH